MSFHSTELLNRLPKVINNLKLRRFETVPFCLLLVVCLLLPLGTLRAQSSSAWAIQDVVDTMSDGSNWEAVLNTSSVSNGHTTGFVVKAACAKGTGLDFYIHYTVPRGADQHFRLLNDAIPGMRFSVDDNDSVVVRFQSLGPAYIRIGFPEISSEAKFREAQTNPNMSTPSMIGAIVGKIAGPSITAMDIFAAHRIRLEFPLENGDSPILDISPQSASFKVVANHCRSIFLAPPVHEVTAPENSFGMRGGPVRFAPLNPAEVSAIERVFWQRRAGLDTDFSSHFTHPEILPIGTRWTQVQMIGPENLIAGDDRGPGLPTFVEFPVGQTTVVLAKLQDGRIGMIPGMDWRPGEAARYSGNPLLHPSLSLKTYPRADQEFSGTAEEFAKALPTFTQKTAAALGVNASTYQAEESVVIDLVKKCSDLFTPTTVRDINRASSRSDLSKLAGGKYLECGQMEPYPIAQLRAARGEPVMQRPDPNHREYIVVGPNSPGFYLDGKTFSVKISFTSLPNESIKPNHPTQQDLTIVEATIHTSAYTQ
jgi:hypothetical protein